jgi:DNA polymerase-3 subunit alpha
MSSFAHLHVHTEYSMLDGAARVADLVAEVARQEMPAIAMTDHGNVFGAFDFYKQAKKVGVKPIIGIEAYVAPESRFEKKRVKWADGGQDDVSGGGAYTHMTILAENNEGLSIYLSFHPLHPWKAITTSRVWIVSYSQSMQRD